MSLDPLFTQLLSDDDTKVLEAIERVDQRGDAMAIVPLLHALVRARDHAVQQRITTMLFAVKAKGAQEQLLAALDIPELLPVRSTVLASFWNTGMDMREHLLPLVSIAAKGSASEALECLTIVQEQSAWPEKAARAAAKDLRLASTIEKDELKASVLADIAEELERRLGK